jgi:tRNA (mo5U34)-methyltransferase
MARLGASTALALSALAATLAPGGTITVPVTLAPDCLLLDRRLSDDEFSRYRRLIEERRSWGYYQRVVVQDAAGRRFETPGSLFCHDLLMVLDRFRFPRDLTGKTVLDIGCNAGFYSFAAKLRGAKSVLGLDHAPHYIEQARLLREILHVDVDFCVIDGHSLDERLGTFDIVINTGVIYHLQNPMDFLGRMAKLTGEMMYLESEVLTDPKYAEYAWFIEKEYRGDSSNWWIYGPRCVERMARAAGFPRVEFQGFISTPPPGTKTPEGFESQSRGVFICEHEDPGPAPGPAAASATSHDRVLPLVGLFTVSREFRDMHSDLKGNPNQAHLLATQLYQGFLGRVPTGSERSTLARYLAKTGDTRAAAEGFLKSEEYAQKKKTDEQVIRDLNHALLGRAPSDDEVGAWAQIVRR